MGQLEDMALFARIVEAGSISRAAEQLSIAKSAVSRRLSELEQRLGAQLLVRTTRTQQLTDAGKLYFERSQTILDNIDELNDLVTGNKANVVGTLKLSAPLSFGLLHLSPLLDEYAQRYPALKFEVDFSDRHVDLIEEGLEMAIRIGHLPDSSIQAKRLTTIQHAICASPQYLDKHGEPTSLTALKSHDFLHYGLNSDSKVELIDSNGKLHKVATNKVMAANNGDFLKQMALRNHGIICLPTFMTYQELANGELVPLLLDYRLPAMNAYAVYPQNRFLPQRCRRFIDFLAESYGDTPFWDNLCSNAMQQKHL